MVYRRWRNPPGQKLPKSVLRFKSFDKMSLERANKPSVSDAAAGPLKQAKFDAPLAAEPAQPNLLFACLIKWNRHKHDAISGQQVTTPLGNKSIQFTKAWYISLTGQLEA